MQIKYMISLSSPAKEKTINFCNSKADSTQLWQRNCLSKTVQYYVELVRNLVAHGDAREGKWTGNWRMEWVASTLTPPPNVVYPALLKLMRTHRLPAADWTDPPTDLNGLVRFGGKTKSGFCACAITFRTSYNSSTNPLSQSCTAIIMVIETTQSHKSCRVLDKNNDTFRYMYECACYLRYDSFALCWIRPYGTVRMR